MSSTTDLSLLCAICRRNPFKYTCPRCSFKSCSLKCVKLHKTRAQCSGIRDASKMTRQELFTDAGLNKDYNFITGIERGIDRADRIFIHEKGIIPKRSERDPHKRRPVMPKAERDAERDDDRPKPVGAEMFNPELDKYLENQRKRLVSSRVMDGIKRSGVTVVKAPLGMQRNKDNTTCLAQSKCVSWQVEWITDDGSSMLERLVETAPLGGGYEGILVKRARAAMTPEEVQASKKRKANQCNSQNTKRRKLDNAEKRKPISACSYLQNPKTSCWNVSSSNSIPPGQFIAATPKTPPFQSPYYFYLLKPLTPSSQPKILIPLDSSKPLREHLRYQTVLEFPTIYVSMKKPKDMPKSFMMEEAFLAGERRDMRKIKAKGKGLVNYSESEESESGSDPGSDSESDSASDSDSNADPEPEKEREDSSDEDENEETSSETSSDASDDGEDTVMMDTR